MQQHFKMHWFLLLRNSLHCLTMSPSSDTVNFTLQNTLHPHTKAVNCLTISPDKTCLISIGVLPHCLASCYFTQECQVMMPGQLSGLLLLVRSFSEWNCLSMVQLWLYPGPVMIAPSLWLDSAVKIFRVSLFSSDDVTSNESRHTFVMCENLKSRFGDRDKSLRM